MSNKEKKFKNIETLDIKAKKKKSFIIVVILVSITVIIFISIGSALLSIDSNRLYKHNRSGTPYKSSNLKLIQNPEYKENWAISIENEMETQNRNIDKIMLKLSNNQEGVLTDLKKIIREESDRNSEDTQLLGKTLELRIKEVEKKLNKKLEDNRVRIEQNTLMAKGSKITAPSNDSDLIIGGDLLPDKEKVKSNNNSKLSGLMIIVEQGDASINDKGEVVDNNGSVLTLNDTGDIVKKENPKIIVKKSEDITKPAATPIVKSTPSKEVVEPTEPIFVEDKNITNEEEDPEPIINHKKVIKTVNIDTSFNQSILAAQVAINKKAKKEALNKQKDPGAYNVITGMTQAFMITGAYAPAFQEGESEPLPVLFEAEGDIIMPNDHTATIEKCWLLGSAKGNMNSQTANIKLVSISCVLNGGTHRLEGSLSGWIVGENGIPGIQGELLHKNGAWLARTFVSGFLETFAGAIGSNAPSSVTFGSNGTTGSTSQAVTDSAVSAGATGASTVFNKLGEYYLKMAEQIFPVIEVRGGRTVDILLVGGESLSITENNSLDINNISSYLQDLTRKKEVEDNNNNNANSEEVNAFRKAVANGATSNSNNDSSNDDNYELEGIVK